MSGASRCSVNALSPETNAVGDSQAGGSFGVALKKAGYDAYVIRQWLQPDLVLSDAIRELTGVHA